MPGLREVGLVGAGLALTGGVAYAIWYSVTLYAKKERQLTKLQQHLNTDKYESSVKDEIKTETNRQAPPVSEPQERGTQVLVLGLEGSGKTSILRCFTAGNLEHDVTPTQGFNAVSINREGLQVEFLEIGGGEKVRDYWPMYLKKARVLVFVVDSADITRFPLAKTHLHQLLAAEPHLPLVLLANKQDLPGACGVAELYEVLALDSVGDGRKLYALVTQVKGGTKASASIQDAYELILELMTNNCS